MSATLASDVVVAGLCGPEGRFIEDGCATPDPRLPLALAMHTATAYAFPVAAAFAAALYRRLPLPARLLEPLELALHEAVANAVLHGNLGLGGADKPGACDFAHYCQLVATRLADPLTAARQVGVVAHWTPRRLLLAVTDQGKGFDPDHVQAPSDLAHGHGLAIMRAMADGVAWNQRCRRLLLTFRLEVPMP